MFKRIALVPLGVLETPKENKMIFSQEKGEDIVSFNYDPKNFTYFRTRAITADESNQNGDIFPSEEVEKAYKSFIGVGLYKDHDADSVEKAIGKVLWAEWIPKGKYVECICAIDKNLAPDLAYRIQTGICDSVSMGCSVSEAECSICGNIATTPAEICFVPGTKITMEDGTFKNIEDVKVDDRVLTKDGVSRPVVTTMSRDIDEDIASIQIRNIQDKMLVTKNHPIYALSASKVGKENFVLLPPEYIEAGKLKKNDYVYAPVIQGVVDSDIDKDMARWLGWYASEGHTQGRTANKGNNDYVVGFSLSMKEKEFADEICQLSKKIFNKEPRVYCDRNENKSGISIVLSCKEAVDFAVKHCYKKAKTKRLSKELMFAPYDIQKEFLTSYILGDGCVFGNHGKLSKNLGMSPDTISIATASPYLAGQLKYLIERCGIPCRVRKNKQTAGPKKRALGQTIDSVIFYIHLKAAYNSEIEKNISKYCNLKSGDSLSQLNSVIKYNGGLIKRVSSIEDVHYKGKVYNLEVEEINSYIANEVAVHNCQHMDPINGLKGRKDENGKIIFEINKGINFNELSLVTVPADKSAHVFEVYAKDKSAEEIENKKNKPLGYKEYLNELFTADKIFTPEMKKEFGNLIERKKNNEDVDEPLNALADRKLGKILIKYYMMLAAPEVLLLEHEYKLALKSMNKAKEYKVDPLISVENTEKYFKQYYDRIKDVKRKINETETTNPKAYEWFIKWLAHSDFEKGLTGTGSYINEDYIISFEEEKDGATVERSYPYKKVKELQEFREYGALPGAILNQDQGKPRIEYFRQIGGFKGAQRLLESYIKLVDEAKKIIDDARKSGEDFKIPRSEENIKLFSELQAIRDKLRLNPDKKFGTTWDRFLSKYSKYLSYYSNREDLLKEELMVAKGPKNNTVNITSETSDLDTYVWALGAIQNMDIRHIQMDKDRFMRYYLGVNGLDPKGYIELMKKNGADVKKLMTNLPIVKNVLYDAYVSDSVFSLKGINDFLKSSKNFLKNMDLTLKFKDIGEELSLDELVKLHKIDTAIKEKEEFVKGTEERQKAKELKGKYKELGDSISLFLNKFELKYDGAPDNLMKGHLYAAKDISQQFDFATLKYADGSLVPMYSVVKNHINFLINMFQELEKRINKIEDNEIKKDLKDELYSVKEYVDFLKLRAKEPEFFVDIHKEEKEEGSVDDLINKIMSIEDVDSLLHKILYENEIKVENKNKALNELIKKFSEFDCVKYLNHYVKHQDVYEKQNIEMNKSAVDIGAKILLKYYGDIKNWEITKSEIKPKEFSLGGITIKYSMDNFRKILDFLEANGYSEEVGRIFENMDKELKSFENENSKEIIESESKKTQKKEIISSQRVRDLYNKIENKMNNLNLEYKQGNTLKTSYLIAKQGEKELKIVVSDFMPLNIQSGIFNKKANVIKPQDMLTQLSEKFNNIDQLNDWISMHKDKNRRALKQYFDFKGLDLKVN